MKTLSVDWKDAHRLVEWFYRHGRRYFFKPSVSILGRADRAAGLIAFLAVQQSGDFQLGGQHLAIPDDPGLLVHGLRAHVHPRARPRGRPGPLRTEGEERGVHDLLRLAGVLRRVLRRADARPRAADRSVVRGSRSPSSWSRGSRRSLWAVPRHAVRAPLLYTWALLNYFIVFMNLIPLLELDGYWILADLIQVPDLRPRSLQFIRYDLWRKLEDRERITKQEVGPRPLRDPSAWRSRSSRCSPRTSSGRRCSAG